MKSSMTPTSPGRSPAPSRELQFARTAAFEHGLPSVGRCRPESLLRRYVRPASLAICLTFAAIAGCKDSSRSIGNRIRHVEVQTVNDQGLTLDKYADPREVVYVLLRAIKDDVEAGSDYEAREKAFDRQLAVCAPAHIHKWNVRRSLAQDQNVHRLVWHWAPMLGHYTDNFASDYAAARDAMRLQPVAATDASDPDERARVSLELADPSGDPNASVVVHIELVREEGYWRVFQIGFDRESRHLARASGAPAGNGGPGSSRPDPTPE